MYSLENCSPHNMHVTPVHLDQHGPFLNSSAFAARAQLPTKNLRGSKRNKMCSKDNDSADDKHEATFDLVAHKKMHYRQTLCRELDFEKRCCTVCTCGKKEFPYGRVSHRADPTQSYLFTLTAQNRAYCPCWTGPYMCTPKKVVGKRVVEENRWDNTQMERRYRLESIE